jgi:hypothetical protein
MVSLFYFYLKMKKVIVSFCILFICSTIYSQSLPMPLATVNGKVFNDTNRNGILDKGEKPVKGYLVSNGEDIVKTDSHGDYSLEVQWGESVFPILEGSHMMSTSNLQNSAFYSYQPYEREASTADSLDRSRPTPDVRVDFGLTECRNSTDFQLYAIGDIQVGTMQEVDYADRSIFAELIGEEPGAVNIFLGDEVNNTQDLFPQVKASIERLPQQSWVVLGNHDRDYLEGHKGSFMDFFHLRETATFNRYFGACDYAFQKGNVHFIVLSNPYGTSRRGYKGHFTPRELNFVKNYLGHVSAGEHLVLAMHIPLNQVDNKDDLLGLLRGRGNVLMVSGHLHDVARNIYKGDGFTLNDVTAGASCGYWWCGERDWEGLPPSLTTSGAPRCYFVFRFNKDGYVYSFKGVGMDSSHQVNIDVAATDSTEVHIDGLKDRVKGDVYITVYGACDQTIVECSIDGGQWQSAEKANRPDANVARLHHLNESKDYPSSFSKIDPVRILPSGQVWHYSLPEESRSGVHRIDVQAFDKFGFSANGARIFSFGE